MTVLGDETVEQLRDLLEAEGPLTAKEAAEHLDVKRGGTHDALNRMIRRGEVEREVRVVLGACGQHPYEYSLVDESEAEDDDRIYDEDGGVIPA